MSNKKQKVIVIGAGVIGLATAYELAKRGVEVTVVEDKVPGWAASHGNAGLIYPPAGEPMVNPHHTKAGIGWVLTRGGESPLQFSFRELPRLLGWGMKALSYTTDAHHDRGKKDFEKLGAGTIGLFAEYKKDGVEFEEHPGGFMAAYIDEKQFKPIYDAGSPDSSIELLTGDEAREREPILSDQVVGAGIITKDFTSVYPPSVCAGLAKRLEQMGVVIRSGIKIIGANQDGQKVKSLQTATNEVIEADHFVVAAGGWSGEITKALGSEVPITGGKGYAITLDDPSMTPNQSIFLTEYEAVMCPFDGKLRFTGYLELSGVNMDINPKRIKDLRHVVSRYVKEVPTGKTEEHWTGMRACTPDGLPAIGKLSGLDNVWLGSGHWHFGLTLAPSTAIMLAELMTTGTSTVDNKPFDPARF